ncbi:hypothetical protein L0Y46_01835 [bacterium]|nr:hypothetical protein [bacterium]
MVKNEKGEEVSVGFPHGRDKEPCTTGRIEGIPLEIYGHGPWLYSITV